MNIGGEDNSIIMFIVVYGSLGPLGARPMDQALRQPFECLALQ